MKLEVEQSTSLIRQFGRRHSHRYANWTLKAGSGKYLSVNEQNELILSDEPTVFKVFFIGMNRQFVKLFVTGKGFVKVIICTGNYLKSVRISAACEQEKCDQV